MIVRALATEKSQGSVLATLVDVAGSSYRRPGARLLLSPHGLRIGSISGGCLEEDVLARAREVMRTQRPDVVTYDTTAENDLVWGVGLGCHGVVQVFLEPLPPRPAWAIQLGEHFEQRRETTLAVRFQGSGFLGTEVATTVEVISSSVFVQHIPPPLRLVIFGAGDDAQPLARLGEELGWRVAVADPRSAFVSAERFPMAKELISGCAEELVAKIQIDPRSVAVVMTHHYVHDLPILRALLPLNVPYVGLLGPKKRSEKILADLSGSGLEISSLQRERLHAPVGLDLGSEGPAEVALAVVAEIQACLSGHSARPLRERSQPIHAKPAS